MHSKATMVTQRHKIIVDRSKGSQKSLARPLQLSKDMEPKCSGQNTGKNSLSGPPQATKNNGDGLKNKKQPSRIPPAGANLGKNECSKAMLLSSEWASGAECHNTKTIQFQTMQGMVVSETIHSSSKLHTKLVSKTTGVCCSYRRKAMRVCG